MSVHKERGFSIVKRMIFSVLAGFVIGAVCIWLRNTLLENGYVRAWKLIEAILFQDITKSSGIEGIGIFFIVGQLFMHALQLAIIPLVVVSLSLSVSGLTGSKNFGGVVKKTFMVYLAFYITIAALAGSAAYAVKSLGYFDVTLPPGAVTETISVDGYNPLTAIINAVPPNLTTAFSSNDAVLSAVVSAAILGVCLSKLKEKGKAFQELLSAINEVIQIYMNFLIERLSPIAIFCMIVRALAVYGTEYIRPALVWILVTIVVSLVLVSTIYPLSIFFIARLNPFPFIRKIFKVALFAAATNSSAATLPLNMKTCKHELGCSHAISSFVLPTGMTVNMNGTTAMHMIAVTFIGTAAGINVTPAALFIAAFLSICTAMGTPAIPVAGTTMVYVVMMGIGLNTDLCLTAYSLVLAMNYLPGMAVITLNVVGDAATDVIVCASENELNRDIYMR